MLYQRPGRRAQVKLVAPGADEIFAALVQEGLGLTFAPHADHDDPERDAAPLSDLRAPDGGAERTALASHMPPSAAEGSPPPDPAVEPELDEAETALSTFDQVVPALDARFDAASRTPDPEAETAEQPVTRARVMYLSTNLGESALVSALYKLRTQSRTALEEQGVNVLFLAFGALEWVDPATGETVHSPLLLVPVQLARASIMQPFTLQPVDQDILLNPTLAFKLQQDVHLTLPRLPEEVEAIVPGSVFEAVRAAVSGTTWQVHPEVWLDVFSFEKLVMIQDLDARAAQIATHPLIRALAGETDALSPLPPDLPRARELDDRSVPEETFQVLDADSSQQVAIEWAKRGVSFIIEGPPGTGKSQTIANIIAESLARDKKVLFVSAKMAALEVVYKRLAGCGLASFCLEAHSHRASRGAMVSELGKALQETRPDEPASFERLALLAQARRRLNEHAHALHSPVTPLLCTPFQAHSELAALAAAPDLVFEIPTLEKIDAAQFSRIGEALDLLASMAHTWDHQERHPWRGVALKTVGLRTRADFEFHLGELIELQRRIPGAAAAVAELLALPAPDSPGAAERLAGIAAHALRSPLPPSEWFRPGEITGLRARCLAARVSYDERRREQEDLNSRYTDALVARADLDALIERLESARTNRLRFLDPAHRQDLKTVRAAARDSRTVDEGEALRALKQARRLRRLAASLGEQQDGLRQQLGRMFRGDETPWDEILRAIDWVEALTALFAGEALPEPFINLVCNRPARLEAAATPVRELEALRVRAHVEWAFLEELFPASYSLKALPFGDASGWLGVRLNQMDELEPWLLFQQACAELNALGLGAFLDSARAARLDADLCKPAFLKHFYSLWLDRAAERNAALAINGEQRRKLVANFCRDDLAQLPLARSRIVAHLSGARPSATWADAPSSEVTLLKREMLKRKHHKSIRRLWSEIPNLLLTLKPCLMMSPLSVSQFLAASPVTFDLVIFDEASQLPPEETIAAIARARQIVVAGDHQQLPPTPFFQSIADVEEQEQPELTDVGLESLLQEAAVVLPGVQLNWHYRSRHEALLAFSNHHFYDDRLITFPNAAMHDPRYGVELVHVADGVYDRAGTRTNPIEARQVAELVLEHFAVDPERSLGVVCFSQAQREAVDLEIQAGLRARPELERRLNGSRGEPFFCKSLENVQGDERDIMFFSIGYGKDARGTMTLNFGPLNGPDGARRLNVAITRAREQVKVISSILPGDIDSARTGSRGVRLLKSYMDYADRQGQVEWLPARGESAHGWAQEASLIHAIQQALNERGLSVHRHIGAGSQQIDLAIIDPEHADRYLLGIESDGATFIAANTARDRERLRVQVLEALGWRIHRIYSHDWICDPAAQIGYVLQILSRLETPLAGWSLAPRARGAAGSLPSENGGNGQRSTALVPTGTAIYAPAKLPRQGMPEQFYRASEQTFQDLYVKLAREEGPIHWNAAARRIAACWGIQRITPALERHLDAILAQLVAAQLVHLRDDFIWSSEPVEVAVRLPEPGQEPRAIEEIAIEEIARAVYLNLRHALSLTEQDLVAQTARLLGYPRVGERAKRRIGASLTHLAENGIIRKNNGKFELIHDQTGTGLFPA